MKINYLDLFSGVGGFSLGLQKAGYKFHYHGFSEIDKYSIQTYKRRFKDAEELGTITDINPERLPDIDLVTFGFPCQDLSQAGKRKGLGGERSGLFFEAMRIIRAKKPKYIVFENVKGLLSSGGGKDFKICLEEIANAGYDGGWQLLNTRWFLPQNRQRVYFVGHLRGECRPEIFPITENDTILKETQRKTQSNGKRIRCDNTQANTISSRYYKDGSENLIESGLKQIGVIEKDSEATRVYDPSGTARTIKDGGGMGAKTGLYDVKGVAYRTRSYRGQDGHIEERDDDVANASNSVQKDSMVQFTGVRRLTPLECERLQGFPDGWTEGNSDTQRYKQMGNAVSVPVVQEIAKRLIVS